MATKKEVADFVVHMFATSELHVARIMKAYYFEPGKEALNGRQSLVNTSTSAASQAVRPLPAVGRFDCLPLAAKAQQAILRYEGKYSQRCTSQRCFDKLFSSFADQWHAFVGDRRKSRKAMSSSTS